ncbi:unnamed protein product [Closterium sp. NIES-54]
MMYYGAGSRSPITSGRTGRAPLPADDSAQEERAASETEYLPWANRVDVEDLNEDASQDEEPVDEEAEATLRSQHPISEEVAASSLAMVTPLRPGARGPSVTRSAGTRANMSRTLPRIPGVIVGQWRHAQLSKSSISWSSNRLSHAWRAAAAEQLAQLLHASPRASRANVSPCAMCMPRSAIV